MDIAGNALPHPVHQVNQSPGQGGVLLCIICIIFVSYQGFGSLFFFAFFSSSARPCVDMVWGHCHIEKLSVVVCLGV